MSIPFRLLLPRQLYNEVIAQARAELPNECCGFLAGKHDAHSCRVEKRYPLVNALASPVEYDAEARSLFGATREMRRDGLEVLAIYHSHPTTDPVPSRRDIERSRTPDGVVLWPGVVYLIVSLRASTPLVRAWFLDRGEAEEIAWEVTEEAPGTGPLPG